MISRIFPASILTKLIILLILHAVSTHSVSAQQSLASQTKKLTEDINRQIVYAEGESFRGAPTSSVPAGTQFCGANSEMGSDQDKQDAFTDMARVNLRRAHCGLTWGDGTGTARPKSPPPNPLPSQTSSWNMAGKAADKAQEEWDAKSDEEKDEECKKGALFFFHLCYCCAAGDNTNPACDLSSTSNANMIGEGQQSQSSESCFLPLPGTSTSSADCGCPKNGNNESAATYTRTPCPCCPHSDTPSWWGDAKTSTSGSNLYDPNSGCWRETKTRLGGKA